RIYYSAGSGLGSCLLDGTDARSLITSTYGSEFTVSPDGKWIGFIDLHKAYIAAFPQAGKTIDLNSGTSDFPVKVVSQDAGLNLHWSADAKKMHYTLGNQYFTIALEDRFEFVANKPDSLFKVPAKGQEIVLEIPQNKPTGT